MSITINIPQMQVPTISKADAEMCLLIGCAGLGLFSIMVAVELKEDDAWNPDILAFLFVGVVLILFAVISIVVRVGWITFTYGGI